MFLCHSPYTAKWVLHFSVSSWDGTTQKAAYPTYAGQCESCDFGSWSPDLTPRNRSKLRASILIEGWRAMVRKIYVPEVTSSDRTSSACGHSIVPKSSTEGYQLAPHSNHLLLDSFGIVVYVLRPTVAEKALATVKSVVVPAK